MIGLKKSVAAIKSAGFSHLKVELEADFGRGGGDDDEYYCDYCNGSGREMCNECEGQGYITHTDPDTGSHDDTECDDCSGNGDYDCNECNGSVSSSELGNDSCAQIILDKLSPKASKALDFYRFYYDGSVDSEFTFTLPVEAASVIPEIIEAFKSIGDQTGHMDISGAGMHISVMQGSDYNNLRYLPPSKITNFKAEVSKLLPALFFLASADSKSRSLECRQPRISNSEKYSAIYTRGDKLIEYRVFDTCYQRPEAVFDYIAVIAKTLEYYTDTKKKVTEEKKRLMFGTDSDALARFYQSAQALEVLEKQLKLLKPEYKSVATLKRERNFNLTVKRIAERERKNVAKIRSMFNDWLKSNGEGLSTASDTTLEYEFDRFASNLRSRQSGYEITV